MDALWRRLEGVFGASCEPVGTLLNAFGEPFRRFRHLGAVLGARVLSSPLTSARWSHPGAVSSGVEAVLELSWDSAGPSWVLGPSWGRLGGLQGRLGRQDEL